MDDLIPTRSPAQEALLREMERRSRDLLLVFNPTDEDHVEIFDRYKYPPVPSRNKDAGYGKGCMVLPRFVAMNYLDNMYFKVLFTKRDELVAEENAKRAKVGNPPMNKFEEQDTYVIRMGWGDNPAKKREIVQALYRGVYEEFGRESIERPETEVRRDLYDMSDILKELDETVKPTPKVQTTKKPAPATAPVSNVQPPSQFDPDELANPDQISELTR